MKPTYVLDACAMLAVLANESGADKVVDLYTKAALNEIILVMNKINLLEVYYDLNRAYGKVRADEFIAEVKKSPIVVSHELTDEIFEEAGRFKSSYKISLADSIALAQTVVVNGILITSDHHEFDVIERKENIKFLWIR